MRLFLLFYILISYTTRAQNIPDSFRENQCNYLTDGSGKSNGLKIKIKYPCDWKLTDGERPHVIQKTSFNLGSSKTLVQSLSILKLAKIPSKDEIDNMLSQNGLRKLVQDGASFASGRKVKIDGLDCGEVIVKVNRETPVSAVSVFLLHYYIVYKNLIINLSFGASGMSELDAKELFNTYKEFFQDLATNTVILSRWE